MLPRQTRSGTTRVVNDANARNTVINVTSSPVSTTSSNETLVYDSALTNRKRAALTKSEPQATLTSSPTNAPTDTPQPQPAPEPKSTHKKKYPSQSKPRSHSRRLPAGHVKRPPNAFMLFRSWFLKSGRMPQITQMSEASQALGAVWHNLPDEEQGKWHLMATEKMREHKAMYPQYNFKPNKSRTPRKNPGRNTKPNRNKDDRRASSNSTSDGLSEHTLYCANMVLKDLGIAGNVERERVEAARLETRSLRRARLEGAELDIVRLESMHRKREAVRLGTTVTSQEDDHRKAADMAEMPYEKPPPHPTFDYGADPAPMYLGQNGHLALLPMASMGSNPALVPFTPFTPAAPPTIEGQLPAFPASAHPILVNPDLVYSIWPLSNDLDARPLLPTQADDMPLIASGSVPLNPTTISPLDFSGPAELDIMPPLPESHELPAPPASALSLSAFEPNSIGDAEFHEILRNWDTISYGETRPLASLEQA